MNCNQLKNLYYDLVDGNKDNDDNIKELLTEANAKDIVIEKNKILFNFENQNYIIDKGGGDFDVSDVDWKKLREENSNYREFQENLEFDKTLISSWVDLEIQFYEDDFHNPSEELQKKLKEYENISKKILLISRY